MKYGALVIGSLFLCVGVLAQQDTIVQETAQLKARRLQWWREGRFGMFIHWGPVSLEGTEISWSRGGERRGIEGKGNIPVEVYDNLYKKFDPVRFNAKEWVSIARSAGMKYMVLTAKHCDGFCLWRSKVDPYNIGNTPFKRDVCGELSKAAHNDGMKIGWYYSAMDWRDPDCRTATNAKYVQRMQGHLKELLGDYGRIDLLWFDSDGGPIPWNQERTYGIVRSLQPQLVINDRLWLGKYADRVADQFDPHADYQTPEQRVGAFEMRRPWETCMTIGTQWSWKPNDVIKTLSECIRILVQCVTGDGNLLLNVGPMPDGRIEPRQVTVLEQIGRWLKKYGTSVYCTRGGPFRNGSWGGSTRRGNTVYLHVAEWDGGALHLPAIAANIMRSRVLTGGSVHIEQSSQGIVVRVPPKERDRFDTIVELRLDRPVETMETIDVRAPRGMDTVGISVRLTSSPDPTFSAHGIPSLVDGVRGTTDRMDGTWLGFPGNDFEAVYELQSTRTIREVMVGCLQEQVSSIFLPQSISVEVSENGTEFRLAGEITTGEPKEDAEIRSKDYLISITPVAARYVKIRASNIHTCPDWHSNAGGKAWVLVDEVTLTY